MILFRKKPLDRINWRLTNDRVILNKFDIIHTVFTKYKHYDILYKFYVTKNLIVKRKDYRSFDMR